MSQKLNLRIDSQNQTQLYQTQESICSSCKKVVQKSEGERLNPVTCGHQNVVCSQCINEKLYQQRYSQIYCIKCKDTVDLKNELMPPTNNKPLSKNQNIQTQYEEDFCLIHKEQNNYFCCKCYCFCCFTCATYATHAKHNVRDLQNAYLAYRPLYDSLKSQVKNKTKQLEGFTFLYFENSQDLKSMFRNFEERVNNSTNAVCQMLQQIAKESIQQCQETLDRSINKIENKLTEIEQKLDKIKNLETDEPKQFQQLFR